jgi:hypothetical protein
MSASPIADWEKLLVANPNYEGKAKVEQMLGNAKKQLTDSAGVPAR